MAAGATGLDRLARRAAVGRWPGLASVGALVVVGLSVAAALGGDLLGTLAIASVVLVLTGLLVGSAFSWATLYGAPDPRDAASTLYAAPDPSDAASSLYAADLAGGCVGSLAGSLILVPMGGLPGTALAAVLAAALALLLA